jgi:hypothetical protein
MNLTQSQILAPSQEEFVSPSQTLVVGVVWVPAIWHVGRRGVRTGSSLQRTKSPLCDVDARFSAANERLELSGKLLSVVAARFQLQLYGSSMSLSAQGLLNPRGRERCDYRP